MHPSQQFRTNFSHDEVVDAASDNPTGHAAVNTELHETDSSVRNLCLVWNDGRRAFFNYAYLVSVDLVVTGSLNVMLLYFSGHVITLKGYQFESLFNLLLNHIPKTITATNLRYYLNEYKHTSFVTEILVKSE